MVAECQCHSLVLLSEPKSDTVGPIQMLVRCVLSHTLQIVNLELSPAEFEQHVLGRQQDWRKSLLVEVGQQSQQDCIMAVPLGQWLQQEGIELDQEGCATGLSRFARDLLCEPQPSSSNKSARYHP